MKESRQQGLVRYRDLGLMVEDFKDHVRLESIFIRFCRVRACGGTNPLGNLFISARSQMGYWVRLIIYIFEKVARLGHLLNTHVPPASRLPTDVEVA